VRTRVADLENRHRVTDEKKDDKPTLRRRAPKTTDDSNTEDDRPTQTPRKLVSAQHFQKTYG
jgi:hypothetical protein